MMELTFNPEFPRWEVYGPASVIRNGKRQPVFVSAEKGEAERYIKRVEGRK